MKSKTEGSTVNPFPPNNIGAPAQQARVDEAYWTRVYESGAHQSMWHREFPSSEIVCAVMTLGLTPPCNVIDLGCGAGSEALFLARCGFNVTAVDLSPSALHIAEERVRAHGLPIRLLNADVLDLPLDDASIDFANDRACYHHIRQEDRELYIDELARILRPGGRMLLRVCDPVSSSQGGTTPESLRELFDGHRFHVRSVQPFAFDAINAWVPALMALIERRESPLNPHSR